MSDSQQTRILPGDVHSGAPVVGSVLRERYRLEGELGRGGMGVVYRATDLELHNILFAQAVGYEFLGENATHAGNFKKGLACARLEREIAEKLHSRERMAWMYFYNALCHYLLGNIKESEQEFLNGIALAETIGEKHVRSLLKSNYSVLQATVGRYDEALEAAEQSRQETEADGLLYSRFEGLRCLAAVRLIRAREKSRDLGADQDHAALIRTELNEAERICEAAAALIEPTESRVSRLWLGPTYLEVLTDQKRLAESENDQETAAQKLALASKLLADYEELVNSCQSPRFKSKAKRLGEVIKLRASAG